MNSNKNRMNLLPLLLSFLLMAACQPAAEVGPVTDALGEVVVDLVREVTVEIRENDGAVVQENGGPVVGLANPAALYCQGLGYSLVTRQNAAGLDAACIFPDGNECGQWDFLAGRCGQEYSYCQGQGGLFQEQGNNVGRCVFGDSSTCDEIAFFEGACRPGDNPFKADGGLAESAESEVDGQATRVPVIGWLGYVVSPEAGAQYDDYVVVLPEGEVGALGIEGATETLDKQIAALREQERPGKYAHFWGSLQCDVMDYGGCQLLVERLRVDGPGDFVAAEQVEGWTGKIIALEYAEPGAPQPDDAFVRTGDYPVQYGLDSAISTESGERELVPVIERLRGSDLEVTIWGVLMCGVPDAGGCHIAVQRLEAGDEVYEIAPAAIR